MQVCVYGAGDVGAGWRRYWSTRDDAHWNRLDFLVLAVELLSQAAEALLTSLSGGGDSANATAARTLRRVNGLRTRAPCRS